MPTSSSVRLARRITSSVPIKVRRTLNARRNRPMLMIDISVPRNIDPAVSDLDNVFAFDIDDLEAVTKTNLQEREREAVRAEAIITTEAEQFIAALAEGDINTVIGAFRREINALALAELERSRKRLGPLTADQEEALHVYAQRPRQQIHPSDHQATARIRRGALRLP